MKNKITNIIIILFFLSFFDYVLADTEFVFESSTIELIEDENLIIAKGNVKINSTNEIDIFADESKYFKLTKELFLLGNVKIIDKEKNIIIESNEIKYDKKIELIQSFKETVIRVDDVYQINTYDLNYLRSEKILRSNEITTLNDNFQNKVVASDFVYFVDSKKFKSNNTKLIDRDLNEYNSNILLIDLNSNKIAAKDVEVYFSEGVGLGAESRLKGNSMLLDNENTIINKGVFTTCKPTDDCPPWTMQSKMITHDKNKKIIKYKDALLKLYDVPVFYFPKFFHPDPTVKRQSGFLIPKLLSSNSLGTSFEIPYYNVISDNKDLTFKPRLYTDGNFIFDTEYRQVNKNSNHIADFSFNRTKGALDSDSGTKSHFFSNSEINLDLDKFDYGKIDLQIQQTSNKTYLKTYDLSSPIINNTTTLNSFLNFEASNDNLSIKTDFEVFEDLSKHDTDKYEYIFPNLELVKKINTQNDIKGDLLFQTNATKRQYDTNVNETSIINDIIYESNNLFSKSGIVNKYNFIVKNVNTDAENSSNYKNKSDSEFFSSLMFTSSYPLKKTGELYDSFFTPKISFRYSPNKTRNIKDDDLRIDTSNVTSFNRIMKSDAIEGGQSITLNTDYKITNKEHNELLSLGLATVFRDEEDENMPTTSTLGKEQSNYFGNLKFTPNEHLKIDYNFSLRDDLNRSHYDFLKADISVNNFVTSFEYLEENEELGKKSYWGNTTSLSFNDKNTIKFGTRKNKETNLTEFYNLIYQYKNDCLTAAIEYNKEYYNDVDLQPNEQLYFSVTIVPFTKINSPSFKKND